MTQGHQHDVPPGPRETAVPSEPDRGAGAGHGAGVAGGDGVAWFHCFAGIAGDMALGSLLDAGADLSEVLGLLGRLRLTGWALRQDRVLRGGVSATRALVTVSDDRTARTHAEIASMVRSASLPRRVEERSLRTFALLANVEARLHGSLPAEVHLHELGGHDTVVDVVGTMAALEVLEVDRVVVSAVATGTGTLRSAHGMLPNPPPAVVRLLEGVPTYGRALGVELTTPTGAALVRALGSGFGPMPPMTPAASGFGAGAADLDGLPNCTQVVVGRALAAAGAPGAGHPVTVLEANVDDVTGEQLAASVAALLDAGAHDAWVTPIVMKKGRPAHTVHALCDPVLTDELRHVLRHWTGTFGVRALTAQRWPDARTMHEVTVEGELVRMKVGTGRAKPEPDDVARVAARTGLGLREVTSRAEEVWRRSAQASPTGRGTAPA